MRSRYTTRRSFVKAFGTYCGFWSNLYEPPRALRSLPMDDLFPDMTLRTLDFDQSFKGAQCDRVAEEIHFYLSVGSPNIVKEDGAPLLAHKSISRNQHALSVPFADAFKGERDGIPMLQDDMPHGRKQNLQQRGGGGGSGDAMHRCTAGKCQGVYGVYYIAGRLRLPGEEGNLPAPLALVGTPAGKLMEITGGELGARRFFRKGLRFVLDTLRAYDAAH